MSVARLILLLLLLGPLGCTPSLGGPCDDHEDCRDVEAGYCAVTGICVASCPREGESCDDGICTNAGTRLVCLQRCDQERDCRASDACVGVSGGRACVIEDLLFNAEDL